jgi:hypothetical protein
MRIVSESRTVCERLEEAVWIANARARGIRLSEIDDPYASSTEGIDRECQRVCFGVCREAR